MAKTHKIPSLEQVKTVKVIRSKKKRVKDPIRFPRVIEPMEKNFTDGYLKMENNMVKMLQIELLKQTK